MEPIKLDPRLNALTIDTEDWPQSSLDFSLPITERAVRNTRSLLDIFRRGPNPVRATFFVLGLLAESFPQIVKEIAADGHEIGTHGYSHKPVFGIGPKAFADELSRSVKLLEDLSGQKVLGYRAPDFSITSDSLWALDILAEQGLLYDSSIFPVRTSRYGIGDASRSAYRLPNGLIELPLSTVRWGGRRWPAAGGGYLRLYPYTVTRWAIQSIQADGFPAVVYLHPYEIDPTELDEIEWPVSAKLKLTQGLNRRYIRGRLERLLQDFKFGSASDVLRLNSTSISLVRSASVVA